MGDEDKPQPIIDLGKSLFDTPADETSRAQLNPTAAMARNTSTKPRTKEGQLLTVLAGMLAVIVVVAAGQYVVQTRRPAADVEAAVNLKRALRGVVGKVDQGRQTFTVWYQESLDPKIRFANVLNWTVRLPPGTHFEGSDVTTGQGCYVVSDIRQSLSDAKPAPCLYVVIPGQEVVVEYAVLQSQTESLVAKTIIGNQPQP